MGGRQPNERSVCGVCAERVRSVCGACAERCVKRRRRCATGSEQGKGVGGVSGEKRAGQTERAALEGWEEGKQDEHVCVNRQSNGSGEDGRLDSASRATSCRALGTAAC